MNQLEKAYTDLYLNRDISKLYPDEILVRMFKGTYPTLDLKKDGFKGKTICEIGCGDGRNFPLLNEVGFDEISGTEITEEITKHVQNELLNLKIQTTVVKGYNHDIPFSDNSFDYLISWNACYYMGDLDKHYLFDEYLSEFNRILKKGAKFICSVPMPTHSIFSNCEEFKNGYFAVKNDPNIIRNGQLLRCFQDYNDIENTFNKYFDSFVFSYRKMNCFGLQHDSFIFVCEKRTST